MKWFIGHGWRRYPPWIGGGVLSGPKERAWGCLSVSRNKNLPLSSVFCPFEQLRAIFGPLFNWGEEEPYRHQERELEHTVASLSVGIKPPFVSFLKPNCGFFLDFWGSFSLKGGRVLSWEWTHSCLSISWNKRLYLLTGFVGFKSRQHAQTINIEQEFDTSASPALGTIS